MKKKTHSTPTLLWFFLLLLTINSALTPVNAQGFYTPTNHAHGAWDTRFEILPDGYRAKSLLWDFSQGFKYKFETLDLDASGAETAWNALERVPVTSTSTDTWLPDNDILELTSVANFNGTYWFLEKYRLDGTLLWSDTFPTLYQTIGFYQQKQNAAGEIFIQGFRAIPNSNGAYEMFIYKIGADGAVLWQYTLATQYDASIETSMTPTHDGGCVFNIRERGDLFNYQRCTLGKISAGGSLAWQNTDSPTYAYYLLENGQGDIYTFASSNDSTQTNYQAYLMKHTANGVLVWTKPLNTLFQQSTIISSWLALGLDGDLLLVGEQGQFGTPAHQNFYARFNSSGELVWKKHYALLDDEWGHSISGAMATPDNGFILAGLQKPPIRDLFVLKMDEAGSIYANQLSGQLAIDANVDCLVDSTEEGLKHWKIQLLSDNHNLYTLSDSSGYYEMTDIPTGDYQLSPVVVSNLWEACPAEIEVIIPDTGAVSLAQNIPVQILADCPYMTIDVATNILRRCFPNNYTVQYCNIGTAVAENASIQIVLDPLLHVNSASVPYTQNGDTLFFDLNTVQALECGTFTFNVTVDCDLANLGQTLCVSASITPDSICNPPLNWSGALLSGSGTCQGDSVRFELRNIGTAPTSPGLGAYVVDEHVIMFQQTLPVIAPNNAFNIMVPAHGSTWRLLAEQEPNAPGREKPSIGVEGCGVGGTTQLGFMLQFANNDGNPFSDQDCHEVVGSFDPNDKMAFPIGVGDEHFIEANQPIDYQIRFQNTGTDTAFTVVVKDTLSSWLDPATIRPGASSHPYTWTLSGEGILTFTFDHILLPDSNINEAASHGFFQFNIEQRKDLAAGTRIENRAGIYFDFNEPVITNTVFHTIALELVQSSPEAPKPMASNLEIWPNPAGESITISSGKPFELGQYLVLRNSMGQVVSTLAAEKTLRRADLPPGLYLVELHGPNGQLATGKVVWTR